MSWTERIKRRTLQGRHYINDTGTQGKFVSTSGTNLHFVDQNGNLQTVDMRPGRVNNAQLDGWRVTQAGWHFILGRPGNQTEDGWVGFGGRRGSHWLLFRLSSAGYVHWPTREFAQLGNQANYNRQNLSQTVNSLTLEVGEQIFVESVAVWSSIFPGVDIKWRIEGRHLKEEIIVSQAARSTLPPPATPSDETFFTFVFELDVSNIPRWVVAGIAQNINGDFDDEAGRIELHDSIDALLAYMPLDYVFVDGFEELVRIPLRKRIYEKNGTYYLLVGARVDQLGQLPAGNLVFDPTLVSQPDESAGKDTYCDSQFPTTNYGNTSGLHINAGPTSKRYAFIQFDVSSIDLSAICESAELQLTTYSTGYFSGEVDVYSLDPDVADWEELQLNYERFKIGSPWPGSDGGATAGVDYEPTLLGTGNSVNAPNTPYTITFNSAGRSRIEDWFGAANTNYGLRIHPVTRTNQWSSSAPTVEYRPKLTIVYTVEPPDPAKGVGLTRGPDVLLSSTLAEPTRVVGVGISRGPTVIQASVPSTMIGYSGNIYLMSVGETVSVCLLATDGDNWRMIDAGSNVETLGLEVIRHKAYLVPQ